MRLRETKWELFLEGFHYILSALDAYDAGEKWGYKEFWETINAGWYHMYIYPYDDWYMPTISEERRMRLSESPYTYYVSQEDYDKMVEVIENPPPPSQELINLMNRKAPWENDND
jgi:hypothetical protein